MKRDALRYKAWKIQFSWIEGNLFTGRRTSMNVREAVLTVDETQTSLLEQGPSLIERANRTAAARRACGAAPDNRSRRRHFGRAIALPL